VASVLSSVKEGMHGIRTLIGVAVMRWRQFRAADQGVPRLLYRDRVHAPRGVLPGSQQIFWCGRRSACTSRTRTGAPARGPGGQRQEDRTSATAKLTRLGVQAARPGATIPVRAALFDDPRTRQAEPVLPADRRLQVGVSGRRRVNTIECRTRRSSGKRPLHRGHDRQVDGFTTELTNDWFTTAKTGRLVLQRGDGGLRSSKGDDPRSS
jgi:hypothetical protein